MRFRQIGARSSVWANCARAMVLLGLFTISDAAQNTPAQDPGEPQQGQPHPELLSRPGGAIARQSVDEKAMQVLIHELVGCGTRHSLRDRKSVV